MAKRDYGEGSLYQRGSDGRWAGSFRLPDGRRKTVYAPKDNNKKSVALALMKEARRNAEGQIEKNKQTVAQYLDYWLATIGKSGSIDLSSVEAYRAALQRARPIENIPLQKLTRSHVQDLINELVASNLKFNTINLTHSALTLAMNAAVRWQYISTNPCEHVLLPRPKKEEEKILTAEQCQELLKIVYGQDIEIFIVLALGAGMRKGEICALRWQDVDMEKDLIHIVQAVKYVRHEDGKYRMVLDDPKTFSSKRTIPLAPFVKSALQRHRKRQVQQRLKSAIWQENDLIFEKKGKFVHASTLHARFKKLLEEAGLSEEVKIHGLRHSCNTLLRKLGVDPVTRQQIMGHSRPEITEGDYGHTYDSMKTDAMKRLDSLFSDDEIGGEEAQ